MRFMINNHMTQPLNDEINALFDAERQRVAALFAEGVLENLYVAADFSQAWLVVRGESVTEAQDAAASLPLARFMQATISPLAELQ